MQPDDRRRRQILDAASRLLQHYGPAKTTMAEIAREAAIGVGTVYLEFASKDAIIEALSCDRHAGVLRAMRAAATDAAPTYSARLRAVFDAKVTALLRVADEGAHASDLVHCAQHAVQTAYARFRADEADLLATLLRDGARAGELDVDDPAATAAVLLYAYGTFAPPWLYHQPRDELSRTLARLHDLVLLGLVRRTPKRRCKL